MDFKHTILVSLLLGLSSATFSGCGTTDDYNGTTVVNTGADQAVCLSGDKPTIFLEGDTTIEIPLGTYTVLENGDPYSACDPQDGDLSSAVVRDHNINFEQAGTYQISYNVTDSDGNAADTKYRTVIITGGDYTVYTGMDTSAGTTSTDTTTATDTMTVVDTTAVDTTVQDQPQVPSGAIPTITFGNGDFNTLFINVGEVYDRNDYYAYDLEDGDLTPFVEIGGDEVDTSTEGTYTVLYVVTDSDGNTVSRERTIYVGNSADLGTEVSMIEDDIESFKVWYENTCNGTFIESAYNAYTGEYNSEIDCSNQGLYSIDLTPLSIFNTIKSLNLSNNHLSEIDFNQLGLEENNVKVLEVLDLSYNNFSYIDFSPLHNLKNINELWINGNNLDYDTEEEREELYRIFNNQSLTIFF